MSFVADIFRPFEVLYQKQEPLIHQLYDSSSDLVRDLVRKFMKDTDKVAVTEIDVSSGCTA